jgi:hypothetical protein
MATILKSLFIDALVLRNQTMVDVIYGLFADHDAAELPALYNANTAIQDFQKAAEVYPRDIDRLRLEYIKYLNFARDAYPEQFDADLLARLETQTDLIDSLVRTHILLSTPDMKTIEDMNNVWTQRMDDLKTIPLMTYKLEQEVTLNKGQRASFTGSVSKRYTVRWRIIESDYIEVGVNTNKQQTEFYIEGKKEGEEIVHLEHFDNGVLVQTYTVTVTVIE